MKWFEIKPRRRGETRDTEFSGPAAPGAKPGAEALGEAVKEVKKVLRVRRWDANREEPFKGFGSEPGKF
jgi:hypothetical protein